MAREKCALLRDGVCLAVPYLPVLALALSGAAGKPSRPLVLLQSRLIPLLCLAILLLIGYLELSMPTWAQIYQQIYY